MNLNKLRFAFFILAALLTGSAGDSAGEPLDRSLKDQGHRLLNVTVTDIKGDTLFYKTEEGTVRNVALKIVEQQEKVGRVNVGDQLVMEFDEGNQLIRASRPDVSFKRLTVSGQIVGVDSAANKVVLKLENGKTQTYTMIPPASLKMAAVPKGTTVLLDIDPKNNFVKDFEKQE
jgi:hypothetical protein